MCFWALLWKVTCVQNNHYYYYELTWVSLRLWRYGADVGSCESLRVEVTDGIGNPVCGHQCFSHVHVAHITAQHNHRWVSHSGTHLLTQSLHPGTCCKCNSMAQSQVSHDLQWNLSPSAMHILPHISTTVTQDSQYVNRFTHWVVIHKIIPSAMNKLPS